jgi:tetratricopeptide (TPR) repeat protein
MRRKLGDLLVEAGIVKAEQLPKGLEYAQKATEADLQAIAAVRMFIDQGLDPSTAVRALSLTKQRRCSLESALQQLGWRPRRGPDTGPYSAFDRNELDAIGAVPAQQPPPLPTAQSQPASVPSSRDDLDAIGVAPETESSGGSSFSKEELDVIGAKKSSQQPQAGISISQDELAVIGAQPPVAAAAKTQPSTRKSLWEPKPSATGSAGNAEAPTGVPPTAVSHSGLKARVAGQVAEAEKAAAAGDFQKAEQLLTAALEGLEASPRSSVGEAADLLYKLGRVAFQMNQFGRSERYFTRALKIRELHLGADSAGVVECLDALAELFDVQSQCMEAERYYLTSLGIRERIYAPDSSEVTACLKKLVAVCKRTGARPEEKLSGQLLTEAGLLDAHSVEQGLMLANERGMPIGRALVSLKFLNEEDLNSVLQAQLLLRDGILPAYLAIRALRISSRKRIPFVSALKEIGLDSCDPQVAAAFNLLDVADHLLVAERELPPDHPEVGALCLKLGDLHLENRRFRDAQFLYRRAAAITEKDPCDRARFVEVHMRLANLHYSTGEYPHAEVLYTKLMGVFEQDGSYSDPMCISVIENLANVKYMKGQFDEAGKLYELAIGAKQKILGPRHPGLVNALQGRANCFYMLKQYSDAEDLYKFTIAVIENVYGTNAELVAGAAAVLGDLYFIQGAFARAQAEYLHSLDALSNAANPDVELFCIVLANLARCCSEQNDLPRADAYYRHLEKTRHSCGTDRNSDMADAFERHAEVLEKLGQRDESAVARQKAQLIRNSGC